MVLPDREIRKLVEDMDMITPYSEDLLQPASYDVTLAGPYLEPTNRLLDPGNPDNPHSIEYMHLSDGGEEEPVELHPGRFILASTTETFRIPNHVVAELAGKSTLGRLGMTVHVTAGYIDPGFCGAITLEIANLGPSTIILRQGMRIGQVKFSLLEGGAALRPYGSSGLGSHYQNQQGTTPPAFFHA